MIFLRASKRLSVSRMPMGRPRRNSGVPKRPASEVPAVSCAEMARPSSIEARAPDMDWMSATEVPPEGMFSYSSRAGASSVSE